MRELAPSEQRFVRHATYTGRSVLVEGELDIPALRSAFEALLRAHPILRCRIGEDAAGTGHLLRPAGSAVGAWVRTGDTATVRLPEESLDPSVQLAYLDVVTENDRARVTFYAHHSVADAGHCVALLARLWDRYTGEVSGVVEDAAPQEYPRPLEWYAARHGIPRSAVSGLESASRPLAHPPVLPPDPPTPAPAALARPERTILSPEATARIVELGRRHGVTVNALLTAALLRAYAGEIGLEPGDSARDGAWRHGAGVGEPGDRHAAERRDPHSCDVGRGDVEQQRASGQCGAVSGEPGGRWVAEWRDPHSRGVGPGDAESRNQHGAGPGEPDDERDSGRRDSYSHDARPGDSVPLRCVYPVDMRARLNPPIAAADGTNMAGLAAFAADVTTATDVIELAQRISARLRHDLAEGIVQQSVLHFPEFFGPTAIHSLAGHIAVTNTGRVPYFRTPPGLTLTDYEIVYLSAHPRPSAGPSAAVTFLVYTFADRLCVGVLGGGPLAARLPSAVGRELADLAAVCIDV
ncbi:Phthiocerol/phthiodiolone dimycocerosyl transferase C-terminus [Nocardia amikacinitolerans]|uniref:Phthiocerol/phthiodiolone dimycocerosyl transferase n=1 Tax=Nocardia amikacinitolerans TaxID=756689 RepID=A0A285LF25_9NOCA|nr:Phthiocerol/phthiodiolone dimycocerosyl transferase C-terminus [Nocardia amikacinitolerans]